MTKRRAKKIAHGIAYRFVQQAIDSGGNEVIVEGVYATEQDQKKVEAALDEIAQRHFELSHLA